MSTVSLKPSDAVKSSFFASNPQHGKITSAKFGAGTYGAELQLVILDDDGVEHNPFGKSCGGKVVPTTDGNGLESKDGGSASLSDNSGYVKFIRSLVKAGFNENRLDAGASSLIGVGATFHEVPTGTLREKADGLKVPKTELLIVGTIDGASAAATVKTVGGPSASTAAAAPAAGGDYNTAEIATSFLQDFLKDAAALSITKLPNEVNLKAKLSRFLQGVGSVPVKERVAAIGAILAHLKDSKFWEDNVTFASFDAAKNEVTKVE